MTTSLVLLWIILISSFTLGGSWYARKYNRPDALVALYVAVILLSNITAIKIVEFDFGFIKFFSSGTVLIFSVTFLLTDIVNERFGRKETQRMIFIALFTQIAIAAFSYLIVNAKPAPFFTLQEAFQQIFGVVPRIIVASWIAFTISENFDAYIFEWFKKLTKGRHLWMRNAFSSLPAMALDTVIFVLIGFSGIFPVGPIIIGVIATKWIVGVIDIPFMYLNRRVLGKPPTAQTEPALSYTGI